MTTLRQILLALAFILIFESCNNSPDVKNPTNYRDTSTTSHADDQDGPPFKDECKTSFKRLGEYKISNDNCNIYYSGKYWNPEFYSCSWTWGELVYNEFPDDTNVTHFKIHLLDLDDFSIPNNGSDYGHDSIKKYVIAVFSRDKDGGKEKSVFDPFNTGKYPKPKQWTE